MTAIQTSLNAYLKYLNSNEGRTRTNLNRAQLAEFNQAVHAYAVSKRNSSGNSTMNTRGNGLHSQAGSNGSNAGSNAGSTASSGVSSNQANRLRRMAEEAQAKALKNQELREAKRANAAALQAARNAAYQNKRTAATAARDAANAVRAGNVNKVRKLGAAIKKINTNQVNIAGVIRQLKANNETLKNKNSLNLSPANRAKLFNAYKNNTITANSNPALKQALVRAYNRKYSTRGASLGNKFASRFGGPSVRGAEAKAGIKGFFTSAPRLSALRNRLKTSRFGMSRAKILGGYKNASL